MSKALLTALTVGLLACLGCAMKAKPAHSAGFIKEETLSKSEGLPFHRSWQKGEFDWTPYRKIEIAPVNTEHLLTMGWWKKVGMSREKIQEDARRLGQFTKETFEEAYRKDPLHRFEVVEAADSETLVLEMALVEIVPSRVTLNAIGYVPFVGTAAKLLRNTAYKSSIAFEAKIRQGPTGGIVAMFADRESEKWSPINLNDLTWYGHAMGIIQEWAQQFVQVTQRKPGQRIQDSKPFTLKPW